MRHTKVLWNRIGWIAAPLGLVLVQLAFFPAPRGAQLQGVVLGLLTALTAVGIVLVHQANRVLNFAQAELGLLPATVAVMLIGESGWPWAAALLLGIAGSAVLGASAEFLVVRRFTHSPRLVLTVATLGLAQVLAFASLLVPRWWDTTVQSQRIDSPFDISFEVGSLVFTDNHVMVLVIIPLLLAMVAVLLRATRLGIAMRASADSADRASLLGVPVRNLRTLVWAIAATLAFVALFLRAGVLGLPVRGELGVLFFLKALAAAMVGRLSSVRAAMVSAIALDVLYAGVTWNAESPVAADAQMAALTAGLILVTLLAGGRRITRADSRMETLAMGDVRPLARALAVQRPVRALGALAVLAAAAVAVALPGWLSAGNTLRVAALYVFTIVLSSLVVLTGWAGQISLGQGALTVAGAATAGWLILHWQADLVLVILAGGVVGAVLAAVIGLPALRLQGLYLAVTTLAAGFALLSYFLNPRFFDWIPQERVPRLAILGRVDYTSPRGIYFVCLVTMLVALGGVRGIRQTRTGRVLVALRDNEAGVSAFGVSVMRAKLTAFAISGFLAGAAGALFAVHQQAVPSDVGPSSIGLLIAVVVGGLGSLLGAFVGALWFWGTFWWLEGNWRILATGFGALAVLLVAPGGIAMLLYQARDWALQWWLGDGDRS